MDKETRYATLVADRRRCADCDGRNVKPLRSCAGDEFGCRHIGPWTDWQGNLDAELMVVGQEWGGEKNYVTQRGRDVDGDPTNANLVDLVNSISPPLGYESIGPPSRYQGCDPMFKGPHYFTNAMLCLRLGGATSGKGQPSPEASCYRNCCAKYLKEQIDIVQPLVVVTLGLEAYKATARAYGLKPAANMTNSLESDPLRLNDKTVLTPVFHTGYWGWLTRNKQNPGQQKQDWLRVQTAVLQSRRQGPVRTKLDSDGRG